MDTVNGVYYFTQFSDVQKHIQARYEIQAEEVGIPLQLMSLTFVTSHTPGSNTYVLHDV